MESPTTDNDLTIAHKSLNNLTITYRNIQDLTIKNQNIQNLIITYKNIYDDLAQIQFEHIFSIVSWSFLSIFSISIKFSPLAVFSILLLIYTIVDFVIKFISYRRSANFIWSALNNADSKVINTHVLIRKRVVAMRNSSTIRRSYFVVLEFEKEGIFEISCTLKNDAYKILDEIQQKYSDVNIETQTEVFAYGVA